MQLDWQNIDTVLLDMDGTLLDLHYDSHFWLEHLPKVYADKNQLTQEQTRAIFTPIFENHAGTLNWYCVHFWSEQLGFDIMEHKRTVADKIAYRPQAERFLQSCKTNCQDVRMVTNGHRQVLDVKIERTQIDQYFDQLICSHELGHPKEDQAFWHNLNRQTTFDPQKTLFIDDNETVLESAAEYGIKHIFSIAEPDSGRERTTQSRFEMIETFF